MDVNSKDHLYKIVADSIIKQGGEIYGGYVRDLILGVTPHDIDFTIKLPFEFMKHLVCIGLVVTASQVSTEKTIKYLTKHPVTRLEVGCREGFSISIDVTVPGSFNSVPDVDVNQLRMLKNKIYTRSNHNIADIFTNIRNRKFVRLPSCTPYRIQKMLDMGWSEQPG